MKSRNIFTVVFLDSFAEIDAFIESSLLFMYLF